MKMKRKVMVEIHFNENKCMPLACIQYNIVNDYCLLFGDDIKVYERCDKCKVKYKEKE